MHDNRLKRAPDSQSLDAAAACLVFLENDFAAFAGWTDRDKMRGILRKPWKQMNGPAHEHTRALSIPPEAHARMDGALAPEDVA